MSPDSRTPTRRFPGRLDRRQRGVTLIELVIAIVVIGIGVVGVLQAMTTAMRDSADPMVQKQAIAIAQAYMEEIMRQAYADPDGSNANEARDNTSCPSMAPTKTTYDDVQDYSGLHDDGARDQWGCPIDALASYVVDVSVQAATLNGTAALHVTVTVSHAGDFSYAVEAYRVNTP